MPLRPDQTQLARTALAEPSLGPLPPVRRVLQELLPRVADIGRPGGTMLVDALVLGAPGERGRRGPLAGAVPEIEVQEEQAVVGDQPERRENLDRLLGPAVGLAVLGPDPRIRLLDDPDAAIPEVVRAFAESCLEPVDCRFERRLVGAHPCREL